MTVKVTKLIFYSQVLQLDFRWLRLLFGQVHDFPTTCQSYKLWEKVTKECQGVRRRSGLPEGLTNKVKENPPGTGK